MAISQWFTAWSPAGMGLQEGALAVPRPQAWPSRGGTCRPLENVYTLDSLQLQCFSLHKKNQNRCHETRSTVSKYT